MNYLQSTPKVGKLLVKVVLLIPCLHLACSDQRQQSADTTLISVSDWRRLPFDSTYALDAPNKYDSTAHTRPTKWRSYDDLFKTEKNLNQELTDFAQTADANRREYFIALPFQDSISNFRIVSSRLIPEDLQSKFPDVRAFRALHIEDSTIQASITQSTEGVFITIISGSVMEFLDPSSRDPFGTFSKHSKQDYTGRKMFQESLPIDDQDSGDTMLNDTFTRPLQVTKWREYRIAVAATGEYTRFHGGKQGAFAAIVVTLNTINAVYGRELGVSIRLVDNNDELILDDGATDNFTNDDADQLILENQRLLDVKIGNTNYDIGHVFARSLGGKAKIGSVCKKEHKGKGTSGTLNPIGDPFDIDFVAHEIGHQFGARHIFNSSGCLPGARVRRAAVEPGSGSTIMGYAGVCDTAENLQDYSDPYFNAFTLMEISGFIERSDCFKMGLTENHIPTAKVSNDEYSIPPLTPFILRGSGFDEDNDSLTYCWEQRDIDRSRFGAPLGREGNSTPNFRSFRPTTEAFRIFPQLSDILANQNTRSEVLSKLNRNLHFTLTVRDNKGGHNFAHTTVRIIQNSRPFLVTSPNQFTTWSVGSAYEIKWSVGRSNLVPINCSSVNISLSVDGGNAFAVMLAASTENDGSEIVTIPEIGLDTSKARIKVEAVGNIFFDISDTDFQIISTRL